MATVSLTQLLQYQFPDPTEADAEGLLVMTHTLNVSMLFSAYTQGIFPWSEQPVCWYSPDPRAVFLPDLAKWPSNMPKLIRKNRFQITLDRCFEDVVQGCAQTHQKAGIWLSEGLQKVYCELSHLGYGHSVEVWQDKRLVGGLYGVGIGRFFAGESMFSLVPNASKAAFVALCYLRNRLGIDLFDAQVANPHTYSLGVSRLDRVNYLALLKQVLPDEQSMFQRPWAGMEEMLPAELGFLP